VRGPHEPRMKPRANSRLRTVILDLSFLIV
jgi:hypothetical protein